MVILDERNVLAKELEVQGFGVYDFYENHQVLSLAAFLEAPLGRKSDILLVDTQTILNHPDLQENFKTSMNTYPGVIFIHEHKNEKAQKWLEEQASFLNKIIAQFMLPMTQLDWTMLSNQFQFLWNMKEEQKALQLHMTKFSHELDQVLQAAESEMVKAKQVHEVLIPRRSEEIKGVQFLNKYATGEGGGGEFYDLIQANNKVFQVLISSQSYLVSSALIGLLNIHKQKDFSPKALIQDALEEVKTINSAKKKKSEVELVILELDTGLLNLTVHGWGKAEFYSLAGKGKVDLGLGASQELTQSRPYQLSKGEKLIVFSPGFIFNWKEGQIKQDLHSFLNGHRQLAQADLLMELFFQLKNVKESDFLSKDATVVMMEVNRHGIHKI